MQCLGLCISTVGAFKVLRWKVDRKTVYQVSATVVFLHRRPFFAHRLIPSKKELLFAPLLYSDAFSQDLRIFSLGKRPPRTYTLTHFARPRTNSQIFLTFFLFSKAFLHFPLLFLFNPICLTYDFPRKRKFPKWSFFDNDDDFDTERKVKCGQKKHHWELHNVCNECGVVMGRCVSQSVSQRVCKCV